MEIACFSAKISIRKIFTNITLTVLLFYWGEALAKEPSISITAEDRATVRIIEGELKDSVLLIRPSGDHFISVLQGMQDDIDGELTLIDITIDTFSAKSIDSILRKYAPKAIVIMENKLLNAYKKYRKNRSIELPTIVVAALFVDKVTASLPNTTGILYEIPAVTSLVSARALFDAPAKTYGVLYRPQFQKNIEQNQSFLSREKISLTAVQLPSRPSSSDVKKGLEQLKKANVDGIWVTNDSGLLKSEFVGKAWIPFLKSFKKPVVVGVETLIKTQFNFGNFVVYPDHYGLGAQTASVVLDLMENNWQFEDTGVQQPISVKKQVNVSVSKKRGLKIRPAELNKIDKIVE